MTTEKKTSGNQPICLVTDNGSTSRRLAAVYADGSKEVIRGKGPNGIFVSCYYNDGETEAFDADALSLSAQNPEFGKSGWKGALGSTTSFIKGKFTAEEIEAKYTAYQISTAEKQIAMSLKGLPVFASRSHSVSDVGSAAIQRAVEKAGMKFSQFISEQAAVVFGYVVDKNLGSRPDLTFFVWDSGGFSNDFCTGVAGGGRIDIRGTRTIADVAGIEMSRRLGELVLYKGARAFGISKIDINKLDLDTRFQFEQRIEVGKINLSTHKNVQFTVTNPDNGKVKSVPITQDEYHVQVLDPLLKTMRGTVEQTLADAKMSPKDVEFLIGSGAPLVNRYMCDWLGKQFGRPLETDVDPSLAVIHGVAAFAFNELTKEGKTLALGLPEIRLTDRLPAIVAVMMQMSEDPNDLQAVPLFKKDTPVPSEAILRSRLIHKDQNCVDIMLVQTLEEYAPMSKVKLIGKGEIRNMPREAIMTDRLELRGKLRSGGITDLLVVDTISQLSTFITAHLQN